MKCEICGQEAPFFIDSYLTHLNQPKTFHLCERHMMEINIVLKLTIDELHCQHIVEEERK